jgi:hypothetical protein
MSAFDDIQGHFPAKPISATALALRNVHEPP